MTKKYKAKVPTIEEDGIRWAPLSYIQKELKKKNMGKNMETLIRELRERNIRCEKKLITKVMNNKKIWAIPLTEYNLLMKQYENLFYLIQLHPEGDGSMKLLVKLGRSNAPEASRSKKYKPVAPRCCVFSQWFCPIELERIAIKVGVKDLAIPYEGSKELYLLLKVENLEKIKANLDEFFQRLLPVLDYRPLNLDDYKYDPLTNSYYFVAAKADDLDPDDPELDEDVNVVETKMSSDLWVDRATFIDWREKVGLSQRQVGEKVGISGRAIGYYETGENVPSSQHQKAIAQLMSDMPNVVA